MGTIYSNYVQKNEQETIELKTFDSFLEVIKRFGNSDSFFYRGISQSVQKYPNIIRKNNFYSLEQEIKLLKEFEKYYGLYKRVKDCWEFIALAQHHGLFTRLIDFTNNIFVAFFFCLYKMNGDADEYIVFVENKNKYECAQSVQYNFNNGTLRLDTLDDGFSDVLKHRFGVLEAKNKNVVLEPDYADNRIFYQQGLLLVPGFVSKDNIENMYQLMPYKIIIKKEIRNDILRFLSINGYDEYRLMPDLTSVCLNINKLLND